MSALRARRGRVLKLPRWCAEILEARRERGTFLNEPVFCDALGGFRDPNNVRRDLRQARALRGSKARQALGAALARARRSARLSRGDVARAFTWPSSRIELVEAGRVRVEIETVAVLADFYEVKAGERSALLSQAKEA